VGILFVRETGVTDHQVEYVRNVSDFRRDARLVCQQRGVTVRIVGVITVHGADGPFTHVARHNQNSFFHEENELSEVSVGEQAAQLFEFGIWDNPSAGDLP
jgi:hypothetical protein